MTNNNNKTFVRCPSCKSLVPALSTRCRMCGASIEVSDSNQEQEEKRGTRIRQKTMTISEAMKDAIREDLGVDIDHKLDKDTTNPFAEQETTKEDNFSSSNNTQNIDEADPLASFLDNDDIFDNYSDSNDSQNDTAENNAPREDIKESFDDKVKDDFKDSDDDIFNANGNNFDENNIQEAPSKEINENEPLNEESKEEDDDLFSDLGDEILSEELDFSDILEDVEAKANESIHDDELYPEDDNIIKDTNDNKNFVEDEELYEQNNENHDDINDFSSNYEENDDKALQDFVTEDSVEDNLNEDDFDTVEPQDVNTKSGHNPSKNNDFDDEFLSINELLEKDKEDNERQFNKAIAAKNEQNDHKNAINNEKAQRITAEIEVSPSIKKVYENQRVANMGQGKKNNIKLNFGKVDKNANKETLKEEVQIEVKPEKVNVNVRENTKKDKQVEVKEASNEMIDNTTTEKKIEIKIEKVKKEDVESETKDLNEAKKVLHRTSVPSMDMKGRLFGWIVSFKNPNGKAFELREGKFFVTKNSLKENDLIINDESISTPHAMVTISKNNGLVVQDLMSDMGIFLKHSKDAEYEKQELPFKITHGDWVKFGNVEYLVSLIAHVGE